MSNSRFATKRPGYLASSISFTEQTDVGLLTINLFKKDLCRLEHGKWFNAIFDMIIDDVSVMIYDNDILETYIIRVSITQKKSMFALIACHMSMWICPRYDGTPGLWVAEPIRDGHGHQLLEQHLL